MNLKKNLVILAWIIEISILAYTILSLLADLQSSADLYFIIISNLIISIAILSRIPLIKSYQRVKGLMMISIITILLILFSFIVFETLITDIQQHFDLDNQLTSLEIKYIFFLAASLALIGPTIAYLSIFKIKDNG